MNKESVFEAILAVCWSLLAVAALVGELIGAQNNWFNTLVPCICLAFMFFREAIGNGKH